MSGDRTRIAFAQLFFDVLHRQAWFLWLCMYCRKPTKNLVMHKAWIVDADGFPEGRPYKRTVRACENCHDEHCSYEECNARTQKL